jgi:hypothetical protein
MNSSNPPRPTSSSVEQGSPLKTHADPLAELDPLVLGHRREVLTLDQDAAPLRPDQADQGPQQRGLAGAAATENHEDLALSHREADTVEYPALTVGDDQVLDLYVR